MADEIDLNDDEEAALEAAWAKRVKKKPVEEEPATDDFDEEVPDEPIIQDVEGQP